MFEWARNEFDGQSIEIIGQLGSTTFMPLSITSINTTLRGKALPKDEINIIKKLMCEIRELEYNKIMFIENCAYEELIDFLEPIINDNEEIFKVRFNQKSSNEFEFYADDEFMLAGYTMAFMIAASIDEIIDVSHYFKNQKIEDLVEHDENKDILTVITFSDGRQLAVFFQDDEVNLLLGTVQFVDKITFRYGECVDILEWKYNDLYDAHELVHTNASEWQDYFGEDGCSNKDDEYEENDEYDDDEDDDYYDYDASYDDE